jgi:hypothetical protein
MFGPVGWILLSPVVMRRTACSSGFFFILMTDLRLQGRVWKIGQLGHPAVWSRSARSRRGRMNRSSVILRANVHALVKMHTPLLPRLVMWGSAWLYASASWCKH